MRPRSPQRLGAGLGTIQPVLTRPHLVFGLLAAAFVALAGCGTSATSFDPSAACTADVRQAGAYPSLEAMIPATFQNAAPARLDSGRNCTPQNLATLADHGISEVRFAGGLWDLAPGTGVTMAVFEADGLSADWMGEFYEHGAADATKIANLVVTHPSLGGANATRLDYSDSNLPQAIVVWPGAAPGQVRVVLAAGVPERIVQDAIATFGG